VKAITHRPNKAPTGIKQSSAHQGEWPVRFSTMEAGIANNASATVIKMKIEVLGIIGIVTVPVQMAPAEA
jgi:hypothetical protein